jgi:hypothetical protein
MAEQDQRSAMGVERELHLLRFSIRCLTFCSNASARCPSFTSPCPLLSLASSSSSAASTRTSLGSLEPTIEPLLVWLLPVPKLPPTQLTRFHELSLEFLTSQPPVLCPGDWVAERLNALALIGEEGLLFLLSTLDLTSCPSLSKSPSPCPIGCQWALRRWGSSRRRIIPSSPSSPPTPPPVPQAQSHPKKKQLDATPFQITGRCVVRWKACKGLSCRGLHAGGLI